MERFEAMWDFKVAENDKKLSYNSSYSRFRKIQKRHTLTSLNSAAIKTSGKMKLPLKTNRLIKYEGMKYSVKPPLQSKENKSYYSQTNVMKMPSINRPASMHNAKIMRNEKPTLAAPTIKPNVKTSKTMLSDHNCPEINGHINRKRALVSHRVQNLGKKRRKVFTINTYASRGELETLQYIIRENKWGEGSHPNEGHLVWFGLPLKEIDIKLVLRRPNVHFNKFSGTEYLWRKKVLWAILNRMKKYFSEEFSFVPREFLYPEEKGELNKFLKNNPDQWMIAKPSRGCGGEGIFLFKNKFQSPILNNEFVVQKYISKPLLIENKKFDLRLYVLIKNLDPLEAYFCNEGLVRFCTEDYNEPTDENIDKLFMHLTNFTLNKENENYVNPLEYGEENKGTKRLLSQFFEQLGNEENINTDYVKEQMVSTIRKTVVSLVPYLKAFGKKMIRNDIENIKCFQIIGIDIMLDEDCNAWLMEINANPSMNMYLEKQNIYGGKEKILSELDKHLKTTILQDAFHIVRSKEIMGYGWFEQILPVEDKSFNRFYIWEEVRQIFHKLGGIKQPDQLTASQFCKLGRYPTLTCSFFGKADYSIVFKQYIRGFEHNYMGFEEFFGAIETIVSKKYISGDAYSNLKDYVDNINAVLK